MGAPGLGCSDSMLNVIAAVDRDKVADIEFKRSFILPKLRFQCKREQCNFAANIYFGSKLRNILGR